MTFNLLSEMFGRESSRDDVQGFVSLPERWRRSPPILVKTSIDLTGSRCLDVKRQVEQGRKFHISPPPVLTGSHGDPTRFLKKGRTQ